jgi:hypothetical protein
MGYLEVGSCAIVSALQSQPAAPSAFYPPNLSVVIPDATSSGRPGSTTWPAQE